MNVFYVDHLEARSGDAEFINQGGQLFHVDMDGARSSSGRRVSDTSTLSHSGVYNLVSKISGDICRLDLMLHRRGPGDSSEPLPDHPLSRLVRNPNQELNGRKFWRRSVSQLLIYGNLYIEILRDGFSGMPEELVHGLADRSYPQRPDGRELIFYLGFDHFPWFRWVSNLNCVHVEILQDMSIGFAGLPVWRVMRDMTGLGLSQQNFMAKFYARGGRPGGFLVIPDGSTTLNSQELVKSFRNVYEDPDSAFKVLPLVDGADFKDAQHTFKDTEMVDSKEDNARDAARFFNTRPGEIGLPDAVSYNSRSDDARAYVESTILPITRSIESELDFKLLTSRQRVSHFFRFDTTQMVQMDFVSRANAYTTGISAQWLTPNEARARENLAPLPGGDTFETQNEQQTGNGNGSATLDRANGRGATART